MAVKKVKIISSKNKKLITNSIIDHTSLMSLLLTLKATLYGIIIDVYNKIL